MSAMPRDPTSIGGAGDALEGQGWTLGLGALGLNAILRRGRAEE
jgi:hypothetical protein